jgi:hypothetical protein
MPRDLVNCRRSHLGGVEVTENPFSGHFVIKPVHTMRLLSDCQLTRNCQFAGQWFWIPVKSKGCCGNWPREPMMKFVFVPSLRKGNYFGIARCMLWSILETLTC